MEAKEKANEMVEKYYQAIKDVLDVNNAFYYSQQCALIAVDEIIRAKPCLDFWDFSREVTIGLNIEYWQQVKQEIEKL